MGTLTPDKMALALFDNALFPSMGRLSRGGLFSSFDRMMAETTRRQQQLLSDMNVDVPEGATQHFSYSSSTIQRGDAAPVTQRTERWSGGADAESVTRTYRAIGDQVVEETIKGGETTRNLHNLNENELPAFEKAVAARAARSALLSVRNASSQMPRMPC